MSTAPETTPPAPPTADDLQAALARDVAAHIERDKLYRNIAADPLPGPSAQAFAGEPVIIHGLTFRPVVGGDVLILKRLDSPLIRRTKQLTEFSRQIAMGEIAPDAPPPEINFTDAERLEMIFQFTRPIEESQSLLARGTDHFRAAVAQRMAGETATPKILLPQLVQAVEIIYTLAFNTFLGYEARDDEKAKTTTLFKIAAGNVDGFGWFSDYYCQLRVKCHLSHDEVINRLPLAQGFVLIAWSTENNGLFPVSRLGRGYIGQELDLRLDKPEPAKTA